MNKKNLPGYVQTFVMVGMFVLMLVLCGLYIRFAESFGAGSLPAFPENEILRLSKDSEQLSDTDKYIVSPYLVAARGDGVMYAEQYGLQHGDEIWQEFVTFLSLYGGRCEKLTFDSDTERESYLENLYQSDENYFYARFANDTEFSVLLASLPEVYSQSFKSVQFKVRDMFLLEGAQGVTFACAVSGDGDVLKIYSDTNLSFNKDLSTTYNNTDSENFEFVRLSNDFTLSKNGYFPVFRHSVEFPKITREKFSEVFTISESSSDAIDFLSIFGINSDNAKNYRTSDGDLVYVEGAVRLSVSRSGIVEYIPGDEGVPLSEFLSDSYSLGGGFQKIFGAAKNIAEGVNKKLGGFAAGLSLENIIYRDGKCEFYFNYTVQSVPVNDGDTAGLYIEFSGNNITYALLDARVYTLNGVQKTDMPQKTAFVMMKKDMVTPVTYFGAEYSFDGSEGFVRWIARVEGVAEK